MLNKVNNFLKNCDNVCDKLPVISTISNIVDLFQKCVLSCLVLPIAGKKSIEGNSYYTHLNDKNFGRCILLLIPVLGNLVVGIYDFVKTEDKETVPKDFIRAYKQSLLKDIESDATIVSKMKEEFKNDKEFLLSAIEKNPEALEYIKEEFKNDKDFQKEAKKRIIMKGSIRVDAEHSVSYLSLELPRREMKKTPTTGYSFVRSLDVRQGEPIFGKMVPPLSEQAKLDQEFFELANREQKPKSPQATTSLSNQNSLALEEEKLTQEFFELANREQKPNNPESTTFLRNESNLSSAVEESKPFKEEPKANQPDSTLPAAPTGRSFSFLPTFIQDGLNKYFNSNSIKVN